MLLKWKADYHNKRSINRTFALHLNPNYKPFLDKHLHFEMLQFDKIFTQNFEVHSKWKNSVSEWIEIEQSCIHTVWSHSRPLFLPKHPVKVFLYHLFHRRRCRLFLIRLSISLFHFYFYTFLLTYAFVYLSLRPDILCSVSFHFI